MTDFVVYYGLGLIPADKTTSILGNFMLNDLYKAMGFITGTAVTYNLNKFWTWRQTDKSSKRLGKFIFLYAISFVINIAVNKYSLQFIPDNDFVLMMRKYDDGLKQLFAMKIDKLAAFFFATAASTIVNFVGQKLWVFKPNGTDTNEEILDQS